MISTIAAGEVALMGRLLLWGAIAAVLSVIRGALRYPDAFKFGWVSLGCVVLFLLLGMLSGELFVPLVVPVMILGMVAVNLGDWARRRARPD